MGPQRDKRTTAKVLALLKFEEGNLNAVERKLLKWLKQFTKGLSLQ